MYPKEEVGFGVEDTELVTPAEGDWNIEVEAHAVGVSAMTDGDWVSVPFAK